MVKEKVHLNTNGNGDNFKGFIPYRYLIENEKI